MYEQFGLFVGGAWRPAANGAKVAVMSPVTGAPLGEVPVADVADTEAALPAAEAGLRRGAPPRPSRAPTRSTPSPTKWSGVPPRRRG